MENIMQRATLSYIVDVIEGRRKSRALKGILKALSYFYQGALVFRHKAYDKKWLAITQVPVPVISVGNIVAGGTGKTPFTLLLAEELASIAKLAILTRGYRSRIERKGLVVAISKEQGPSVKVEECGDEPYLLASRLKDVAIWVGKDRCLSAKKASEQGATLLLLDDGMQYRKLARQIEVVMVDAKDPFGKGAFLPHGFLRELPERLAKADLIVINHVQHKESFDTCKTLLGRYTAAPMIGTRLKVKNQVKGAVGAFCGIGKPERFFSTLEEIGCQIVDRLISLDHFAVKKEDLERFAERCKTLGATTLVCTEKDAVKLPQGLRLCLPILPIEVDLSVVAGLEQWQNFLKMIRNRLSNG